MGRPLLPRQLGEKSAGESCKTCETSKPQPAVLTTGQATLKGTMKGKQTTATSKAPYSRPRHDKLFCEHCTDFPQGFRGLHELSRHHERNHNQSINKWICIEPIYSTIKPTVPLSKCKACSTLRKTYGAKYNAAAHLRRVHFTPKQRGTRRNQKPSSFVSTKSLVSELPMSELEPWLKEIRVPVYPAPQHSSPAVADGFGDESPDEFSQDSSDDLVLPDDTASMDPFLKMTDYYANRLGVQDTFYDMPQDESLDMRRWGNNASFGIDDHFLGSAPQRSVSAEAQDLQATAYDETLLSDPWDFGQMSLQLPQGDDEERRGLASDTKRDLPQRILDYLEKNLFFREAPF